MNPSFSNVIWIRLEQPSFDLIGVILSSLGLTAICVGVAIALGSCWGLLLIRRGRERVRFEPELGLGLDAQAR